MSTEKQISRSSPGIIARLMGLDTLSSPHSHKPQKESKNRSSKPSKYFREKLAGNNRPCQNLEEFRRNILSRHSRLGPTFIRQIIVNAKSLSADEKLRRSDEFDGALEVLESNKDLFLRLLREPQSLSSNRVQDQNSSPNDSARAQIVDDHAQTTQIAVLKPGAERKRRVERTIRSLKSTDKAHYDVINIVKPSKEAETEIYEEDAKERCEKSPLIKLHEGKMPRVVDLHEVEDSRNKIRPKNHDSTDQFVEDTDAVMSGDELTGDILKALRDEDDWDYSYLLDVLIDSGILKFVKNRFCGAPSIGVNVFEKLEKKYGAVKPWSRLERKLLFDLINSALSDISAITLESMCMWPWRFMKGAHEGLIEEIWQALVRRRKGNNGYLEEMAIGESNVGSYVEMLGKMVCEHLIDVLIEELVSM